MSGASKPARRGRYYEDFTLGAVYKHWPGRTVYEGDNRFYCIMTMNLSYDEPVIHPGYLYSLLLGLSANDVTGNVVHHEELRIRNIEDVQYGDTIYAETEVLVVEEIDNKPGRGLVVVETHGYTQDRVMFMSYQRRMGVRKRAT